LANNDNNNHTTPPYSIWEVVLHPCDMLYIPAFFFHKVTTGNDSISINAWFGWKATKAYEKWTKNVDLPFERTATIPYKLAALGSVVRSIRISFQSDIKGFKWKFLRRYIHLIAHDKNFAATMFKSSMDFNLNSLTCSKDDEGSSADKSIGCTNDENIISTFSQFSQIFSCKLNTCKSTGS
jgi:hypothetical protein